MTQRSGCKPDANAPKPVANMGAMISCRNTTMADLAQDLQMMAGAYMERPVLDATGLDGGWNFLMGWTPKAQLQKKAQQSRCVRNSHPANGSCMPSHPSADPSMC